MLGAKAPVWILSLLLFSSFALAEEGDAPAGDQTSSEGSERFGFDGIFAEDTTEEEIHELEETVASAEFKVRSDGSGHASFYVGALSKERCDDLLAQVSGLDYVDRTAACEHAAKAAADANRPTQSPKDDQAEPDGEDGTSDASDAEQEEKESDANATADPMAPARAWEPRHISYDAAWDELSITDFTVDGVKILDNIQFLSRSADVEARAGQQGHILRIGWDDTLLSLHDTKTGLITFKAPPGSDGQLLIDVADNLEVEDGRHSARIHLGDKTAVLVSNDIQWLQNGLLIVSDHASIHVGGRAIARAAQVDKAPAADRAEADMMEDKLPAAIANRNVGARVHLPEQAAADPSENSAVEAYDDMEVTVQRAAETDPDSFARIHIQGDLSEGRTIVVSIPEAWLDGPELGLRYYDIHADGLETEVLIRQADSLEDALDPNDETDGGNPEYWVVRDANGLQAIITIPVFSDHAITLQSFGEVIVQPSVIAGLLIGLVGSAGAGAALFWPRRMDE